MTNFDNMRHRLLQKAGLLPPVVTKFKPTDLKKLEQLLENAKIINAEELAVLEGMTGPVENLLGTIKSKHISVTEFCQYHLTKQNNCATLTYNKL